MRLLPFLMLLALLLVPWAWALAAGRQVPGAMLRSRCDAAGVVRGVSDGKQGLSSLYVGSSLLWHGILPTYKSFSPLYDSSVCFGVFLY